MIVCELGEELCLFGVYGLDESAARKEVFDLDRRIEAYGRGNPGNCVAKGLLVANAWRRDPPSARGQKDRRVFSQDAVDHAQLLGFALIDTRDLYRAVTDVVEGKLDQPEEALARLVDTTGVYAYP